MLPSALDGGDSPHTASMSCCRETDWFADIASTARTVRRWAEPNASSSLPRQARTGPSNSSVSEVSPGALAGIPRGPSSIPSAGGEKDKTNPPVQRPTYEYACVTKTAGAIAARDHIPLILARQPDSM